MNRQPCGSPPIFESIDGGFRAEASEDPVQSVEETLHESQPSVQTASFHQQSPFHAAETTTQFSNSSEDVTVSADQERQVLLLMLLAQVCALHDPTPKTFTIHVVELYERGLLNRDSINFLFELGLVPSISPAFTNALLQVTRHGTGAPIHSEDMSSGGLSDRGSSDASVHDGDWAACIPVDNELALTTTVTHNHNATKLAAVFAASGDPQRSAEAYAIRATLAQYEQMQRQTRSTPSDGEHETGPSVNDTAQPWDANHFPLSLSRYQREFVQIALLASGSFGQVFHATRKMDGCDYAIKKVDFGATGYSNETIQEVVREVECLAKVSDHPNVVRYYTSWLEPSWMTGGQAVELTAPPTSPSGSPTRIQRRRQSHQRLLLANPLQDLIPPASLSDDGAHQTRTLCDPSSRSYDDSSRFFNQCGSASFESKEASSIGMWQRRRFSFGSDLDADDQNWGSYHEQSLEALERPTVDDEEESSSSIFLMRNSRNPQDVPKERRRRQSTGATASNKPVYRYQLSLYIQMQLCHPASLADWIRERNCKVPETAYEERMGPALEIFEQITMGLAHVHEKGVIHRDLKPANIFVSSDGRVIKIGDFGLSKQVQRIKHASPTARQNAPATLMASVATTESSLKSHDENVPDAEKGVMIAGPHSTNVLTHYTKAPMFVDPLLTAGIGTRSYAAPEQLNTKTYSTAADIFSLGLIFLELVCCFETEHERLHNFQRCRQEQIVPQWLSDDYPEIATIIIACSQSDAMQRPSAKAILGMISARQMKKDVPQAFTPPEHSPTVSMGSSHTPIGGLHNALLRRSIERRDRELEHRMRELAEKEKEIEQLRKEMEHLKASRTPSNASSYAGDSDDTTGDDTH